MHWFPSIRRLKVRRDKPERDVMLEWLAREWAVYADPKFDDSRPAHDRYLIESGTGPESWWANQVVQYLGRANTLGLDTLSGRQAILKCLAAMTGLCESVIRVYGPPPEAGVASGEIVDCSYDHCTK